MHLSPTSKLGYLSFKSCIFSSSFRLGWVRRRACWDLQPASADGAASGPQRHSQHPQLYQQPDQAADAAPEPLHEPAEPARRPGSDAAPQQWVRPFSCTKAQLFKELIAYPVDKATITICVLSKCLKWWICLIILWFNKVLGLKNAKYWIYNL